MTTLSLDRLTEYRALTFRSTNALRLHSPAQAVDFVNARGFVFFWPIKGILLPSLWVAAAGDRPVPNEHDDPGHITWGWKDDMLGKRVWYYSRLLRRRNTMVSLKVIPYFYALSPNYGDPEADYLIEYDEGRMPLETKLVYEALLKEGAMDTLALRKAARLTGPGSETGFNRALEQLQVDLRILPVGVSQAGAWHYSFIYDLVNRHWPSLIEEAGAISEHEARRTLVELYLRSVGAATLAEITKIFNLWRAEDFTRAVDKLVASGTLAAGIEILGQRQPVVALPELL